MHHSRDHVHTPRWLDTATDAWAFATRGDAAIIAKKHGGVHPQLPIGHAHLLDDGGEHAGRQDAPGVGECS